MELQFEKQSLSCLRSVLRQVQTQEQTQEVRISDGMPDIGSVLGAWGQVILRGKQWQDGEASVNGGVMVWVLYRPEDGGAPCSLESWIPFQMRWELPRTERDGNLQISALLRSVDARNTSARKFMLRTNVSALLQAWEPCQADMSFPGELPPDIRLKTATYPVELPAEAGEKSFSLEESLSVSGMPKPEKLISYRLQPEVLDKKIMTDKMVFRGCGLVHIFYQGEDGEYYSADMELPFSQYTQLDKEYGEDTPCTVLPGVTTLEAELEDDQLKVKAGLVCQYTVCPRSVLEVVEDAYSPLRKVEPIKEQLQLPVILDSQQKTISMAAELEAQGQRVADVSFWPDQAETEHSGNGIQVRLPGALQMLYYDADGQLENATRRVQQTMQIPMESGSRIAVTVQPTGSPQASLGMNARMQADILTGMCAFGENGITMVTGLAVGEEMPPDPNRPSLILRRAGEESLWDTAKRTGSTVESIQKANGLEGEPLPGQILIIPVL